MWNDGMVGECYDVMLGIWIWLVKMIVIMDYVLLFF